LCILFFGYLARQNYFSILFTNDARDDTQADGVSIMITHNNAARLVLAALISTLMAPVSAAKVPRVHCWEPHEITLKASGHYSTIYRDVSCWVRLQGRFVAPISSFEPRIGDLEPLRRESQDHRMRLS
jgi:hypothetical protein